MLMVLNKMKRYSTSPVMGNVLHLLHLQVGFPGGSEGSVCLQCRRPRFDPWGRKWQLTLVLRLGKSHGWRSLVGYGPWGCNELDTTKQLHFTPCKTVGEANSCFESNPIPARDTQRAQTNLVHTRTQRPHRHWVRTVSECLLWWYGSAGALGAVDLGMA